VPWVEKNVMLRYDTSSQRDRVDFALTPYLRDPLEWWATAGRGKMTCMAVEQTGKSSVWKWGTLWLLDQRPGPMLVVYPSDDDAAETNRDSLEPLMAGIPKLAAELSRPKSHRADSYSFSFAPMYFTGAGRPIISKPIRYIVGDEVDYWVSYEGRVCNVVNLDKRGRTFDDAKRVLVCSPTVKDGVIYREFLESSRGWWHLRCAGCGNLTMRSADVHNLQWALTDGEEPEIIRDSLRLICPACKTEHPESVKREMTNAGAFIHERPDRLGEHAGFQWGALATCFANLDWLTIARAQMLAGKTAGAEAQKTYDNSFRGIPWMPRRMDAPAVVAIRSHCAPLPAADDIEGVFFAADTQDDCWYWVARAVLKNESTALLGYGKAATQADLEAALKAEYLGITPVMGIIDEGGHRAKEVQEFARDRKGLLTYKGNPRIGKRQTISRDNPLLLLVMPSAYQGELLYYIYTQADRTKSYWYLPDTVGDDYVSQVAAVKENAKVRSGDQYENWTSHGDDHYFDCEKMCLALIDYAKHELPAKYWKSGAPKWASGSGEVRLKPRAKGGAGNGWLGREGKRQGGWLK
jgi:phage terminase large subunit GpA-like protein